MRTITQLVEAAWDPLTIAIVLVLAVLTGWRMRPRLRYSRISNNAMLVMLTSLVAAAFGEHIMRVGFAGLVFDNIRIDIININFGNILIIYALTWLVIFIINGLRRRISRKNKDKYYFKGKMK